MTMESVAGSIGADMHHVPKENYIKSIATMPGNIKAGVIDFVAGSLGNVSSRNVYNLSVFN